MRSPCSTDKSRPSMPSVHARRRRRAQLRCSASGRALAPICDLENVCNGQYKNHFDGTVTEDNPTRPRLLRAPPARRREDSVVHAPHRGARACPAADAVAPGARAALCGADVRGARLPVWAGQVAQRRRRPGVERGLPRARLRRRLLQRVRRARRVQGLLGVGGALLLRVQWLRDRGLCDGQRLPQGGHHRRRARRLWAAGHRREHDDVAAAVAAAAAEAAAAAARADAVHGLCHLRHRL